MTKAEDPLYFNSLWPSDAIWWHRTEPTLVQVMACCLTATNHYLDQCWLTISEVLWHSPESNFKRNAQDIYPWYELENYWFRITVKYYRDQWVKHRHPIEPSHKSHNASDIYPTMHYLVHTSVHLCIFLLQNGTLWDMGLLWDLWIRSITLPHIWAFLPSRMSYGAYRASILKKKYFDCTW